MRLHDLIHPYVKYMVKNFLYFFEKTDILNIYIFFYWFQIFRVHLK